MPCLSIPYDPAIGPLINLILTPPAVMKQIVTVPGVPPPAGTQPPVFQASALIDTGASITSVTATLAAQAALPLIGKRNLGTAGGVFSANLYVADIAVIFGSLPAAPPGSQIAVANLTTAMMENVPGMEFNCASPHFNMLLGRDIICQGILSVGFDRRCTFSL